MCGLSQFPGTIGFIQRAILVKFWGEVWTGNLEGEVFLQSRGGAVNQRSRGVNTPLDPPYAHVWLCCPWGNFLSWGATSQLKEPRRTKNFYPPARPKCQKNLQPPLRTKMIPLDNKARPSGQNNPCTHPWDTKFTWFPWDYEKIKLSEADKKCKKNWPRKKMCLGRMQKACKIFLSLFSFIPRLA